MAAMKQAILSTTLLLLISCTVPLKKVDTVSTFDYGLTQSLLSAGNNNIKGSALVRQNGGGVVTCAGRKVILFPATEYAKERITALYMNIDSGFNPAGISGRRIEFNNTPKEYYQLTKETICDAQGFFKFNNLPDGEFFVTTQIIWQAGEYIIAGGDLMKRVTINGGITDEIVLSQ